MLKIYILILLFFVSCTTIENKPITNSMKFVSPFGNFTMRTPEGWTQIDEEGTASFIGKIAIDKKDTLQFDLGFWSSLLNGDKLLYSWLDTSQYDTAKKSIEKIDGYNFYIVTPKESGIGISRIYIDSLYRNGDAISKLDLYGANLSKGNQKLFFQVIKTLKFEK